MLISSWARPRNEGFPRAVEAGEPDILNTSVLIKRREKCVGITRETRNSELDRSLFTQNTRILRGLYQNDPNARGKRQNRDD